MWSSGQPGRITTVTTAFWSTRAQGQDVQTQIIQSGNLDRTSSEYEVEQILKKEYSEDLKADLYLVKWKNWPSSCNSWEPLENLTNCSQALQEFKLYERRSKLKRKHSQRCKLANIKKTQLDEVFENLTSCDYSWTPQFLQQLTQGVVGEKYAINDCLLPAGIRRTSSNWPTNKKCKAYREHRETLAETLLAWQTEINSLYPNSLPIAIENEVDIVGPPESFRFISDYIYGEGVYASADPVCCCDCGDNCSPASRTCCPQNSDADFAYTVARRVRLEPGSPIYECNKRCKCSTHCRNRVVQNGRQVKIAIFRTKNGRGWGVKACQKIKQGTFIMEYLGEIITSETAEERGRVYDAEGCTYLFDLDFHDSDAPYTIDARNYGNESHFVNHSCEPNMSVYGVWINDLDVRLPRIALFANRDISNGEELTFDYKMTGDTTSISSPMNSPRKMSPFKWSPHNSAPKMLLNGPTQSLTDFGRPTQESKFCSDSKSSSVDSGITETCSMTTTDSTKSFSCKNYRIACRCGAKKCRKFLF